MIRVALLSGLGHTIVVVLGLLIYVLGTRINHQRRHPSAAIGWVLGMVAFPYATLPLFLLFGVRKFARPARRYHWQRPPPEREGPSWAAQLLAGMEVAPAVRNERVTWHESGPHARAGLLDTISSARRQLDVCTYVFAHDEVGREVARALIASARRGVAVRLLVDAVGSLAMPRGMLRALAREGVQVRRFMPILRNPLRGRTNLRNHRKLVVADGWRLWSGGRNLACEYFMDRPGRPAWVDLSFEVYGPVALHAHLQFGTDWRMAKGRVLRKNRRPFAVGASGQVPEGPLAQWIATGPDHADDTVHALLMAAAYHAQERILAVTPYFVPDDGLLDAWCLACRRGVQVSLLVPERSNHRLADIARERALRQLVAAGARVWLAPGMMHAKAVLVDDDLALAGSLNLDARSLFLNYEAMTAFYDEADVRWLSDWCAQQVAQARPYAAHRPSLLRDMGEGVVRALGFQL
ncbi:cardiolipin synthase [Melaminivora alkalimesophila]|uniref:Cardiolipin synthase n=4 Tax=Melaminivora alkalimesophila TaxID=1165852 RepID=A0A317RFI0_9BURK|nr:phospholipase D-like domain-containing protein [Melaminivora alkalimesophila]PWW47867.1 cardiolipin synthase [Melaminivora alkalimesophila]